MTLLWSGLALFASAAIFAIPAQSQRAVARQAAPASTVFVSNIAFDEGVSVLASSELRTSETKRATLGSHIGHVLLVGAKKEVVRITARRIVASVADKERPGWPVHVLPQKPMSRDMSPRSVKSTAESETAIATAESLPGPRPAGAWAARSIDMAPETIDRWNARWHGTTSEILQ